MSIPVLNTTAKIQNECENSNSFKQKKSDNALDMDLVEKETVTAGPVKIAKTKEIVSGNMDNSKDLPGELAVWAQYGPTNRPLQNPEYPLGPEGFVFPQTQVQPKTAQGGYPTQVVGPRVVRGQRKQAHAYSGGGSPLGDDDMESGRPPPKEFPRGGHGGGPGKGGGHRREEDLMSDTGFVQEWEYTPATKNGWVMQIMILVVFLYFVTTVTVLIMDETMGNALAEHKGIITVVTATLILVIIQLLQTTMRIGIEPPPAFFVLFVCVPCMCLMLAFPTVVGPTYVAILLMMAMTITSGLLMLLACTNFDFNSWGMYVIVPGLCLAVLGALLGLVSKVLYVEYESLELSLILIVTLVNACVYVYLLQTVLSGNYEEYGDNIYVYAATMLYTTIILMLVIIVTILGQQKPKRRGRRRP